MSGTDPREILYPTNLNTQVTATFTTNSGSGVLTSSDNFNSGTWSGGTGWSSGWTTSGTVVSGVFVELNGTTANPQITRTLAVPIPNATLSFDWDLDRIGAGESGKVEVYDGAWRLVWEQADSGADPNNAGDVNLLTATIDLSAYGSISQIRFTLNASGSNNRFYIDNVSVTGTVAAVPTYTLTVNSGSGSGSYTNGAKVAISASNLTGKVFYRWTGSTQVVNNVTYTNALVTMSTNAVNLTATYVDIQYTLTVNGGTGGGSYTNARQVAITADAPAVGKAFDKWIGDTQYLAGATVTMPATNVTLTATYVDVYYALTVNGGAGDGSYTNGTQVAITADAPAVGKAFDKWIGDTQYLAGATVTMPATNVTLTATYVDVYYALTANGGAGGTVSPASASVVFGGSTNFVITASNYYRIATLTTNGTSVTGMSFDNNSTTTNFTWSNVQNSGLLAATFTEQVVTNPAASGANVPYSWMARHGLTNSGATFDQAAVVDQDSDGLSAWQEYITGTDPTNVDSGFKAVQNNRNTISWSPVSGRVYSVYWATNLMNGFQCLESNIPWTQGVYTNATPDGRVNHYQIKVRMQ